MPRSGGLAARGRDPVDRTPVIAAIAAEDRVSRLGVIYTSGAEGVPADDAKAVSLLTAACDLGRGDACDQLSKRAEAGDGTKKDHAKAIALLAKGCAAEDYQAWTCNAFNKAKDAKDKEVAKAVAALKKACSAKGKNEAACAGLDRIGAQ